MSADWNKYSTPEETRQRAKKPSENGVIVLLVGGIQGIPDLKVRHVPEPTNKKTTLRNRPS